MSCKLCKRLVISDSVTFSDGNVLIDIPSVTYGNGCSYCIVVAQAIPTTATVGAPVYITIGGNTTNLYPLQLCNCVQATACQIRTRRKYSVTVQTNTVSGVFRLREKINCGCPINALPSLPIPAATAPAQAGVADA